MSKDGNVMGHVAWHGRCLKVGGGILGNRAGGT